MSDTPTNFPAPKSDSKGFFDNVPSKFTFIFGLIIGVAAFSLFGYVSLLTKIEISGKSGKTQVSATNSNTNTAGQVAGDTTNTNTAPAGPVKAVDASTEYVRGNKDAKVSIVEYSDLECPYCKTFHATMLQVIAKYPNDVKWVYRHFPLSFHQNAQKESEAALCVGNIGGKDAYWKFVDDIFSRTTSNGTGFALDQLGPLAKEAGVDQSKFQTCLDSGKFASAVSTESSDGSAAGVTGTPTTFILDKNNKVVKSIPGAYDFATVDAAVTTALAVN